MALPKNGWLFSLRADRSQWGDYEIFHHWMFDQVKKSGDDTVLDLGLFGTTFDKNYQLRCGDGLAVYHSKKAVFPNDDIHKCRPRISLLGEILEVEQEGRKVSRVKVKTPNLVYAALLTHPFLRTDENEVVFERIFNPTRQVALRPIFGREWGAITGHVDKVIAAQRNELKRLWPDYIRKFQLS